MTKEKLFQRVYAKELIAIARGDFESTEILAASKHKGRRENICFSAQQCIEKALKAVICSQSKPVPMTHTIELLLDRLGAGNQPPLGEALIELTDFATIKRYQEGSEIITDEDVQATVDAAKMILEWAEAKIGLLKLP